MQRTRIGIRAGAALAAAAGLASSGCGTLQAYDGERLPSASRATVQADPVVSAGLPVQVILRKAGDWPVPARRARVELEAGRHVLIVDCRVAATGTTARFAIEADLEAGRAYRLVADATAQRCQAVRLEHR